VWGAGHALTPGHGKTVVGAYLVGSRGTAAHAASLGLTVTATHTAGVFALGLLTLFASRVLLAERLYPWLGAGSGLLVALVGLHLCVRRLRTAHLGAAASAHDHTHHHGLPLDHGHHHADEQVRGHADHHDHAGHSHLPPGADGTAVTWRSLLALGVSGGLLPCPSALVVLLSAIALGRVGLGVLLVVAFSAGLAGALTGVGLLLVYAGRQLPSLPAGGRLTRLLPIASALLIALLGVGITLQSLAQTGALAL
jgi:ABC-type nickel/cobalt efflux system permease component RcnA